MRIIKHKMAEELAIKLLGWKWVSFIDVPIKGTEGYPKRCRVRQLLSAKQMKSERWQSFLREREASDATGDEPLSYAYCSSQGSIVALPRFVLLVEEHE